MGMGMGIGVGLPFLLWRLKALMWIMSDGQLLAIQSPSMMCPSGPADSGKEVVDHLEDWRQESFRWILWWSHDSSNWYRSEDPSELARLTKESIQSLSPTSYHSIPSSDADCLL